VRPKSGKTTTMEPNRSGSLHSFRSNGASLGDPESENERLSGIVAARQSLSSSSSEEESETGMSSRESSCDSSCEDLDMLDDSDVLEDAPKRISGRGALIGGVPIPQEMEKEMDPPVDAMMETNMDDLESGVEAPPDSDFASDYRAPSTIFPSDEFNSMRQSSSSMLPSWLTKSNDEIINNTLNKPPSQTSCSSGESLNGKTNNKEQSTYDVLNETSSRLRGRPRRLWYMLGAVSCLLLASVIAVAVLVFGKKDGLTAQQQQLHEIAYKISSEKDLQNKSSPQALAYDWLVNVDTLYAEADEVPEVWAIQRYVLAVFYFSTMGPYNWEVSTNWLEGSECLGKWEGLSCSDQGYVRTVAFGKFWY